MDGQVWWKVWWLRDGIGSVSNSFVINYDEN